jgi:hypothetical protein
VDLARTTRDYAVLIPELTTKLQKPLNRPGAIDTGTDGALADQLIPELTVFSGRLLIDTGTDEVRLTRLIDTGTEGTFADQLIPELTRQGSLV